ncbi:hypothetical protein PCH_Pc06g02360 [Penicillium rubens Wisconsin 54-1255]|uniref:Uncharacterized protein n=1 Tax=Penicillium rubens (strain ATCC 28089 / DSM 1075 / NRRL 1951 / Wisconsin 54-1255) TaxID=500485 RepID=B6GWG8_PENRW|nr:hypothetical protein PCH_Pc06g02360 [Penicillium rubens Wisconsin 54-1255]
MRKIPIPETLPLILGSVTNFTLPGSSPRMLGGGTFSRDHAIGFWELNVLPITPGSDLDRSCPLYLGPGETTTRASGPQGTNVTLPGRHRDRAVEFYGGMSGMICPDTPELLEINPKAPRNDTLLRGTLGYMRARLLLKTGRVDVYSKSGNGQAK